MIWYLFSFEGRINRAKYWLAGLVICGLMLFLIMLLFVPISYLFGGSQKLSINFNLTNIFAVFDPQSYPNFADSTGPRGVFSAQVIDLQDARDVKPL